MYNGFSMFGVIWGVMAVLIVSMIVIVIIVILKSLGQWKKDNNSPRLTVPASVVAKRTQVSGGHGDTSTSYYATFQVDSGDRMELRVSGTEYGQLAEGDRGSLTFQGSRYLDFKRTL